MRCWSAVPECRSTLARAGLAFKYPATLLVFMGWSICISSECHGRGSISQRTASPPIKLKVINLFSGIAGGFSYASARLSYPPRRVFFSVEMIFEIPEAGTARTDKQIQTVRSGQFKGVGEGLVARILLSVRGMWWSLLYRTEMTPNQTTNLSRCGEINQYALRQFSTLTL